MTPNENHRGADENYRTLRSILADMQNIQTQGTNPLSSIRGVLSMHDDAIINTTEFFGMSSLDTTIITTFSMPQILEKYSYRIHVRKHQKAGEYIDREGGQYRFMFSRGSNESKRQYFKSPEALIENLSNWDNWKKCVQSQVMMIQNHFEDLLPYAEEKHLIDGENGEFYSFLFPGTGQSDVFYVPSQLGREFTSIADFHIPYQTFLECAIPTIVYWIQQQEQRTEQQVSVRHAELCTTWDYAIRGRPRMVKNCLEDQQGRGSFYGVYHPFKLKEHGIDDFSEMVERLQGRNQ